ncbi:variant protein kinase 19 family protein [Schizosaccharomyces osmophilus]|uniref:Variant protein kinase 19 family protein n=1 Tax=Schizosaccharomyces osmophilus TaxID=2545709 RepID=A0AAF0AX55_9SCHI|nr:variant protein kinase 19 family protein [Schizosaccharomyces osmophilus]WBW73968.1 variant protein kinase 19 family protein [Schizosaccharomyces osmophilus]
MPAASLLTRLRRKSGNQVKIDTLFSKRKGPSGSVSKKNEPPAVPSRQAPLKVFSFQIPPILLISDSSVCNCIAELVQRMFEDASLTRESQLMISNCPRVIVETQLTGLYHSDFTSVSRELEAEIRIGNVRRLYLHRSDSFSGESCLVLRSELNEIYQLYLNKYEDNKELQSLIKKLQEFLQTHGSTSYSTEELSFSLQERRILTTAGFLTLDGTNSYGISLPNLGVFTHILHSSRKDLIQFFKKKPFYECIEASLLQRNLSVTAKKKHETFFGWKFRLCDAIGAGLIDAFMTSCGRAYRLTRRGLEYK